uniref:Uncharacterized protein n=1 Tax=Trichobilharzia regenti TaxID=157069 RepID=A0AA85K427_TRIRE|nr:unnamed protein product [Trichobilharzia regenti]
MEAVDLCISSPPWTKRRHLPFGMGTSWWIINDVQVTYIFPCGVAVCGNNMITSHSMEHIMKYRNIDFALTKKPK